MSDFEKGWRRRCREKGYTDKQCDQAENLLMKAGSFVVGSALTGVACAGASVVSLCMWDSKPVSATYDWCKEWLFYK